MVAYTFILISFDVDKEQNLSNQYFEHIDMHMVVVHCYDRINYLFQELLEHRLDYLMTILN